MLAKKPSDVDRQMGERLKRLRVERGVSQTALGAEFGVTFHQVQKYENGVNRITGARIRQAAAFFGVPMEYFYGIETSDDIKRLIALFESITDMRKRQAILTLIETMVT
jgi:transcriptional regulator with XRE-family HTH domain